MEGSQFFFKKAQRRYFEILRSATLKKKISSKLIINWIRWNEFLKTSDQNFRINDAYQSYYARYFVEKHPQHARLFEFRKLRNEEDAPFMNIEENGQISFM